MVDYPSLPDGTIDWYFPEYAKNKPDGSISDIVTHFPGVEQAVQVAAVKIAIDATARLSAHRHRGNAEVEIARHPNNSDRTPDWYVYLKDADPGGEGIAGRNKFQRSSMSIEFGWTQTHAFGRKLDKPIEHKGLHILGGAMNRAAAKYRGPK